MRGKFFIIKFFIVLFLLMSVYHYFFVYKVEKNITKEEYVAETANLEEIANVDLIENVEVGKEQIQEIPIVNENQEEQKHDETKEINENKKGENAKNNNTKMQTKEETKKVETIAKEEAKSDNNIAQETTPIVETESNETIQEQKQEEIQETKQVQTQIQEETSKPRFCSKGGAEHLDGDGEYEHGYYASWDDANIACMDYLATLPAGGNYMVSRCHGCGLYYYYCKPF